ncbi:hemerythrin domain-containing protein [Aquabacterium sp.]|uniref:hemerythrin domain-containing protein n=1 Tax=Aquabacterium sp. TaxID=1872578 RepID=UPI002DAF55A0|nr:hemerythrin domain-containing protein [Aquabacterium sp.]HET8870213.1 hemerythrin domain-containing protein [Aquabacterium sp.]HEX5313169.1 hemerythrin domain-containing protein [Aquabacterium sp.]
MALLHSPPPSFDDPLEMLQACHGKVRHFAGLTVRLAQHLSEHGADRQARDAAQSVLRYFDVAAPLHHADEDDDLYPALLALDDAELTQAISRLTAEHTELGRLWQAVRVWLQQVHEGQASLPPVELTAFAQRYPQHALDEETLVYPHAKRLRPELLVELGKSMAQRRQTG